MIAILLAPVYLLANYYLLRRVMGWVKAWFPFFRTARHWALPVAVQAFLACSIVIAFFLFFNQGATLRWVFIVAGIFTIIEGALMLANAFKKN